MDFYIVIPAYNEEAFIGKTLQSLTAQTLLPKKIVVVNDGSTDGTQAIIDRFANKHSFITSTIIHSEGEHLPGSKVINAFYKGFELLDDAYDVICKFDADLIFPKDYLQKIAAIFEQDPTCGMAGGHCSIEKNGSWQLESLTNKDHIRGALKAYRKSCFKAIGGLKNTMGWDTVDELLAQFHGWKVCTDTQLMVQHLKPTGHAYAAAAKHKQGKAFYKMRYGFWLTHIAAAKLALKKQSLSYFINCIRGYNQAKDENMPFIVSEAEGEFLRKLRWKGIKKKLF